MKYIPLLILALNEKKGKIQDLFTGGLGVAFRMLVQSLGKLLL